MSFANQLLHISITRQISKDLALDMERSIFQLNMLRKLKLHNYDWYFCCINSNIFIIIKQHRQIMDSPSNKVKQFMDNVKIKS